MGVDYGAVRIGVALSDPLGIFARPHSIITRTRPGEEFATLSTIARENEVARIVVGLPTDSLGGIGSQARLVIIWARELTKATKGIPVIFWDESYSSEEALAIQRASGKRKSADNRKRKPLDDVAAATILQDYLDAGGRDDEPGQTIETFASVE